MGSEVRHKVQTPLLSRGGVARSLLPHACLLFLCVTFLTAASYTSTPQSAARDQSTSAAIERDLEEITVAKLHAMYASNKYTVTQVTEAYLNRIARYDPVYRAFIYVDRTGALATAAAEDTAKRTAGSRFTLSPLWGVPVVIKGNTSVKGFITT